MLSSRAKEQLLCLPVLQVYLLFFQLSILLIPLAWLSKAGFWDTRTSKLLFTAYRACEKLPHVPLLSSSRRTPNPPGQLGDTARKL